MGLTFAERVLAWHERAGRHDLPWQREPSPYRVWVSEIMLQQTQVATVIPYFERFQQRFPDVETLAAAPLDAVLHLWSGLGYYARARNLHRAAGQVVAEHAGRFPESLEAVTALPGIGRSTAGAILALACGQRQPILDGNVKRVLTRHAGIDGWPGTPAVEKRLWRLAEGLTPHTRVAAYTQAMMDLGATLCSRGTPRCAECPVARDCHARSAGRTGELPAPRPRRALPVRDTRMLLLQNPRGEVWLEQRPPSGIWGGLWSLPELAADDDPHDWARHRLGCEIEAGEAWPVLRHTFSHFHLDITPLPALVRGECTALMEAPGAVWYKTAQPDARGLAAPVQKLLHTLQQR